MPTKSIFVGRHAEIEQWKDVLSSPEGRAVLVVGQEGMGKTFLLDKMGELAVHHPDLRCGCVRYNVTSEDSAEDTLSSMLDLSFEAANTRARSLDPTRQRLKQWKAFLDVFGIGKLVMSLRRDPQRNIRDQFIARLELISGRMSENDRAVFLVDSDKHMRKGSDEGWASVVRRLPPKVKLVFAQRPEDCLLSSAPFASCGEAVVCIPPQKNLGVLDEGAIEDLLAARQSDVAYTTAELRSALERYEGHPLALPAAIDLLQQGLPVDELPDDPTYGIAAAQWREVCKLGKEAMKIFEAYAILEVAVPDEVAEAVSGLGRRTRAVLLAQHSYLDGLVRREPGGARIYHILLANHVRQEISEEDAYLCHGRAAEVYRGRLKAQEKPDELAARRLPAHVRASEGDGPFVRCLAEECTVALTNLGLLDVLIGYSEEVLRVTAPDSENTAVVMGNLGIVHRMRGDLNEAERMQRRSLELSERLGSLEGIAASYGNLGNIHMTRGDLAEAERMYRESLAIEERLGRPEYMATGYANLGNIHMTRGDLAEAERMYRESLAIEERLGRLVGMAADYGNLGNVYLKRGDLPEAEKMYRESLKLSERLGRLEGMANSCTNLANVYQTRGELSKAERMYRKALELNERLGRLEGMVSDYGGLGIICRMRGQLNEAEKMHRKSLELSERLGSIGSMADSYGNLGNIYAERGDLPEAERTYRKALELDERLGSIEGMGKSCVNLGNIYARRGDLGKARRLWTKSRDLYAKLGAEHMVEEMQSRLDALPDTDKQRDETL